MRTPRSLLAAALVLLVPAAASALEVRPDRPRMLLSNGAGPGTSLETFRQRCTADPVYMARCQAGISQDGLFPAIGLATGYLVNDDAAKCGEAYTSLQTVAADDPGQPDAHSFISNNGRAMLQLAVVRDWCDPALTDPQKQWIEDRMVAYADWYATTPGIDIFHDDMYNVWSAVAFAGLALKGTAQDAKADSYLAAADAQWKQVILPALAYAGDWWHEGFVYAQPSVGSTAWYATAWTIATDENIFTAAKQQYNDLFEGYIAFHAYAARPDYRYVYFGDTSDPKQSIELFSRYLIDMLTLGTGSAVGQGFSLEIKENTQPGYDYAGANGWMMALFYDAAKDATATPRSALPTARWHGEGSNDVAILRSGWGPDDTFVWLSCGDYLGAHQHYEAGSFQIFKKSLLTGPTGYYDNFDTDHWQNYYSQHAVHANVLSVYQPGEFFPTLQSLSDPNQNVNDGGQRVIRRDENGTAYLSQDLETYLAQKEAPPYKETGDIKTFESADCHDYVACDVTAAYNAPGRSTNGNTPKVNEVTRQFIFLRPDILVVFDRVESTDPSYDKRFLLHGLADPVLEGNGFSITNGPGKLVGQTLLPAEADQAIIHNFEVDGVPHPPSTPGLESGGTRLEISPKQESSRDYFLNVLKASDAAASGAPVASVTAEDEASVEISIEDSGSVYTLRLSKTGDLGGHLTVQSSGQTVCDQDLGEFAAPNPGSGGGGPGSGGGGQGGAGAGGGAGEWHGAPQDGGCGCRAGTGAMGQGALALAAALAAMGMRRRRRA